MKCSLNFLIVLARASRKEFRKMFGRQPRVIHLDLDDVKQGLSADDIVLVDVREPHEFAAGHIPGSQSLPLSQFDLSKLAAFADKRIVFSCAAGVRSIQALSIAQAAGLELEEHYQGGFKEWAGMGEKIEV
jgi:rhodanese-related sulfurtransferase